MASVGVVPSIQPEKLHGRMASDQKMHSASRGEDNHENLMKRQPKQQQQQQQQQHIKVKKTAARKHSPTVKPPMSELAAPSNISAGTFSTTNTAAASSIPKHKRTGSASFLSNSNPLRLYAGSSHTDSKPIASLTAKENTKKPSSRKSLAPGAPTTRGSHLKKVGAGNKIKLRNSASFSDIGKAATGGQISFANSTDEADVRIDTIAMDLAEPLVRRKATPNPTQKKEKQQQNMMSLGNASFSEHTPMGGKRLMSLKIVDSPVAGIPRIPKLSPKRNSETVRKIKLVTPESPLSSNNLLGKSAKMITANNTPTPPESPCAALTKKQGMPKLSVGAITTSKKPLRHTVSTQTAANAKERTKSMLIQSHDNGSSGTASKQQEQCSIPSKRHSLDRNVKLSPNHMKNNTVLKAKLQLVEEHAELSTKNNNFEENHSDFDVDCASPQQQRILDSSATMTSTTTLASTSHESRSSRKSALLHVPPHHHQLTGTSYAGDIANLYPAVSRLHPRSALMEDGGGRIPIMGNYSDIVTHHRLSVDSAEAHDGDHEIGLVADPSKARDASHGPHHHHLHHFHSLSPKAEKPSSSSLIFFGTPLVPIDIVQTSSRVSKLNLMHHKDAVQVLGEIKNMNRRDLKVKLLCDASCEDNNTRHQKDGRDKNQSSSQQQHAQQQHEEELKCIKLLKTAGNATSATLSMTGYKGGNLEKQINHDRALIVSPFYLRNHGNSTVKRRLCGVFDGHGETGSKFAEHCQQRLPNMLSRRLADAFRKAVEKMSAGLKNGEDEVAITKRVLVESFVAMDESSPREASGGCTATVVYQQGRKVYVANTGDSRSIIVVYRKNHRNDKMQTRSQQQSTNGNQTASEKSIKVVYMSREDKPDLPDESKRLESFGGEIVPSEKNKSSKVKFSTNRPGKASATLSMSRSIGDWNFPGCIPDPVVHVIDIKDLVEQESKDDEVDDVCIFAICVSDGMMIDTMENAESLASDLGPSLFEDDAPHPLTACHGAINKVAAVWDKRNKGKFRDDITVAITVLRSPAMEDCKHHRNLH